MRRRTVWVCIAALAILDRLGVIDVETLGWWLAEKQLPNWGAERATGKARRCAFTLHCRLFLLKPLCGNPGVLQPLGNLFPGNPEHAHVDRR
jgi:hypothetical protein